MQQHFRIIGSASYLPRHRITAGDLDCRLGLSPGWTSRHTGIEERYEAREEENTVTMARKVVIDALVSAGCELGDIDMLVDGSLSVSQPIPSNAALILQALGPGAAGIPGVDVHASCLGFVAALQMVNGLCAAGSVRRAVIVCSETPLRGVNWDEADSACLMGDGAAAVVVEVAQPRDPCVFVLQTYGEDAAVCSALGGGHLLPSYEFNEENRAQYLFHMDGKALHRSASRLLPPLLAKALAEARCSLSDLHVVPHQASGPAIEFMARRLGIDRSRLHNSVGRHGNLVAAGIPFVLHEVRGKLPAGTPIAMIGTAAGYSQAVAILTL